MAITWPPFEPALTPTVRTFAQLVSPEEYRRFLERGLVLAERRTQNSFHCKTPDCRGWCIYEDSVNDFRCPICQALNCLLCKVIKRYTECTHSAPR